MAQNSKRRLDPVQPDIEAKRRRTTPAGLKQADTARLAVDTELPPCTLYRLRMATRRATRLYDRALAPAGIGIAQFGVMNAIRANAGGTVTDIARRLDMDRTTLTRNLRPLVNAGLVDKAPGRDERTRALALTPAGLGKLKAAFPLWRTAQNQVAVTLGVAETTALNNLLAVTLARLPTT